MRQKILAVVILGVSLILSALIFGIYFYQSRLPEKTIRVVGAATKRFDSDIIKWRITIMRSTGPIGMKEGYSLIGNDLKVITAYFKANGLSEREITIQPVNANPVYGQNGGGSPSGYTIQQSVFVSSKAISRIEAMALNPKELFNSGVLIQSSSLEYYCSGLSEIKKQLLAAATTDARSRAEKIASSSGDRVGKISAARVGVFQITEPYSTEVADYGIYNTATKAKDITVTMNVTFNLK